MKHLWLLAIVVLSGCKYSKVVSEEPLGLPRHVNGRQSCNHVGYCYGFSFNGKYEFGFSAMCPGMQTVEGTVQDMEYTFDDGHKEIGYDTISVDKIGVCL